jgi:hypothetical protein
LRKDFGLGWSDRHERRFNRTFRILAVAYPRLPRGIRYWFKNYRLRELDRDLKRNTRPSQRQGISA